MKRLNCGVIVLMLAGLPMVSHGQLAGSANPGAALFSSLAGFPLENLMFAPLASPDLLLPNVVNLLATGASLDPEVPLGIGSSLGLQLLDTFVPIVPVLQSQPEAALTYLLSEGGILASDSALALVPSVPLLNSSLGR